MFKRSTHPEIVVAAASAVWGLFWLPLRAFERGGLEPGWIIICQFTVPCLVLSFPALRRWRRGQATGIAQMATGLLVGGGVVLYSESLLQTNVARSLILFYVMPAWGTLVEVGLMGRRFTLWRCLALFLSLAGLFALLGLNDSFAFALNLGDWMALLAGLVFTFGAMRIREMPQVSVFEQVFAFFLFGSLVAVGLSLLPIAALGQPPTFPSLLALTPWLVLMTAVLIPVMWGIYWGSRFVDPGRLGIVLQLEAVVGIGSAALLAGEPFGWAETIGALFVIGAGLVEVWGNREASSLSENPNL
ncbi:MAG: DMT family transporter [Ardenticatenaceae bacterium]|nr:DMT family transporter [Ardenticatenaceae bacterium]